MSVAHYVTAADVLPGWRDDLLSGNPPVLFPVGKGDMARLEFGPGRVVLIGGAPGAGKTAFVTQCIIDAIRLTPDLKVCICNVEMAGSALLDRQLARLSGIDLTAIRHRRLGAPHADRVDQALRTLEALADRLCFVQPPYDLRNLAATGDAFGADLIVLDYVQRIALPGKHDDQRGSINATMDYLRRFADAGVAVVVISAVGRTKDSKGRSSYAGEGLNLASFRESSELEFGADDAYILHPDGDEAGTEVMRLKHLKSRHGECRDLILDFDRPRQSFTPVTDGAAADGGRLTDAVAALWNRAAAEEEGADDGA